MFYDWTMILLLPAILLSSWAQGKVMTNYNRYKQVPNQRGVSGAQVARHLLDTRGLSQIAVEPVQGTLSDHFDPQKRVIRLSNDVYHGKSIAAISIAAHECGHAMQYGESYAPLKFRNAIALPVSFLSRASWLILLGGILLLSAGKVETGTMLFQLGVFAFAAVMVFHGVTLPVELDASRRALQCLQADGIVMPGEEAGAQKVLGAAAMTYVAALAMAVLQFLRILMIFRSND